MKIGIIGTGISGLGAAYLLNKDHDITVFEKNDYPGGHCRTIDVPFAEKSVPVDTGFIVFNHRNYPHLTALFKHLDVETEKSLMTFGVSAGGGDLEYSSHSVFAQARNLFRKKFWGMLFDILRFNKTAYKTVQSCSDLTLGEFLEKMGMGEWFKHYYLQPMGASIWSCSVETILKYPAKPYIDFFESHGLLTINDHPQWYTVKCGSRAYVEKITASFNDKIIMNCAITSVARHENGWRVADQNGNDYMFDHVIFACHGDRVLPLLADPTDEQEKAFGSFEYEENEIVVHGDVSFMPKRKKVWSSWVYLSEEMEDHGKTVSLSYWMNSLQNIEQTHQVFVTLNPAHALREDMVYDRHVFHHPVFTHQSVNAQKMVADLQGKNGLWYCGAYLGHGFHEDGLDSAVDIVTQLGGDVPWA